MKCFSRTLVAAALMAAMAGTATAQSTSGVLNTLELQRLVAIDTAAAHLALSNHYMALADRFAADAARYDAFATAASGNPNHPMAGADARRVREAEAAMVLSEGARAMATYHQFLSMGMSAAPPTNRAMFDGGFGARALTASEVRGAVAAARTAADHFTLEEYFRVQAAHRSADADEHAIMANRLRVSGQRRGSEFAAMHCERLANDARKAAADARAAAALQHQLANFG